MSVFETDALLDRIDGIDWSKFDGPEMYSAANVRDTLRSLVRMNGGRASQSFGHDLLNALGNDHSGEYYPAVIAALDIVIEIAECADNLARCVHARR